MSLIAHWTGEACKLHGPVRTFIGRDRLPVCAICHQPTQRGEWVPASQLKGAVSALQAIYDRHHMNGDGSAGQVAGDALRALGIDPDAGGQ